MLPKKLKSMMIIQRLWRMKKKRIYINQFRNLILSLERFTLNNNKCKTSRLEEVIFPKHSLRYIQLQTKTQMNLVGNTSILFSKEVEGHCLILKKAILPLILVTFIKAKIMSLIPTCNISIRQITVKLLIIRLITISLKIIAHPMILSKSVKSLELLQRSIGNES